MFRWYISGVCIVLLSFAFLNTIVYDRSARVASLRLDQRTLRHRQLKITDNNTYATRNRRKSHGNKDNLITKHHIFLTHTVKTIKFADDIVYFNGARVKRMFDSANEKPHLLLNDKTKDVRRWKDLALHFPTLANQTNHYYQHFKGVQNNTTYGIHVHNEHKMGDLLLLILRDYARMMKLQFPKPPSPFTAMNPANFHRIMDLKQPPMIITSTVDENWGFFSTQIFNRTTKWLNMTNHLLIHYANYHTVQVFLNSSKVALVVGNTHIDPLIGQHEKILNLPLGIKSRQSMYDHAQYFYTHVKEYPKTRLLTINNSGWLTRTKINEMVSKAFNYTVTNTYAARRKRIRIRTTTHNNTSLSPSSTSTNKNVKLQFLEPHYVEIVQSKFVLCPSGLGMDTYRMWETIVLGTIPIVESNPGFDRTYSNLPVLIVPSFAVVTPQFLKDAYECIVSHHADYSYEVLLESYWLSLLEEIIVTGNRSRLQHNHPFQHKYCNYLPPYEHPLYMANATRTFPLDWRRRT